MNRRTALQFGAGFGILGGVGLYGGNRRGSPMLRDLVIAYLRSNGFPREL